MHRHTLKHVVVIIILGLLILSASQSVLAQTQVGNAIYNAAGSENLGTSVALSSDGNRVVVGAPYYFGDSAREGRAQVYEWSGSSWDQIGSDIAGAAGDEAGFTVSMSWNGLLVAIGYRRNDTVANDAGQVRVFEWSGSDWVQYGSTLNGDAEGDLFGEHVNLSADGSRLAITAPNNDSGGDNAGLVRVYEWSGSDWAQLGQDIIGGTSESKTAFSSNGSVLAVGALKEEIVRVYQFDGPSWSQRGTEFSTPAVGSEFGSSVALSTTGLRLVIGARRFDAAGSDRGLVQVYDWGGSFWSQVGSDITGTADFDWLGWSVSMPSDANYLAAGAPGVVATGGDVRLFEFQGSDWAQDGASIEADSSLDRFGWDVSIMTLGNRVAVGAPLADDGSPSGGHVRVFELPAPAPSILLNPTNLDFGDITVGDSSTTALVTITNSGLAELNVSSISSPTAPFGQTGGTCPAAPFNLAPSANCTLGYTFSPTNTGVAQQSISISSNAAGSPDSFNLQGNGVEVNISYNVAATVAAGNGNVNCDPAIVQAGGSSTCTAVAEAGWQVSSWTGACASVGSSEICTLDNIQADQSSAVSFEAIIYDVVATVAAGNGAVSCDPASVTVGGSSTCTAVAEAGWQLSGWTGACASAGTSEICMLDNIQADQTSGVTFEAFVVVPFEVTSIPTLSRLGLIIFGLLMLLTAAIRYRWQ